MPGVSYRRPTAASCATANSRARARSRRDPFAVPRRRVRRDHGGQSQESWIGLWETNRGCPFRCTFCDWGSATAGKVTKFGEERLLRRGRLVRRQEDRVHLLLRRQLRHPEARRRHRQVRRRGSSSAPAFRIALSVQNTKNATERAYETQKILADAGLNKGVALSMQSVDMTTLKAIKRDNISLGHLHGAAAALHRATRSRPTRTSFSGCPARPTNRSCNGVDQADRERPAQSHPVQQPVDPAQRRDGRSRLPGEVRHGHGRVQDHQHPRRARSSSTTTCRKSRIW